MRNDILRTRMFGDAIPAESFAAGANPIGIDPGGNFDMEANRKNGKPRPFNEDWKHSDIKNVAFLHVYSVFEHIIQK